MTAFLLEAIFAWILVSWDLSNFTLKTAVVYNHVDLIGIDNKGKQLFKFRVHSTMLKNQPTLAGIEKDVQIHKKKRL